MTPVFHYSIGNISLLPKTTFIPRKEIQLTRCHVSGKYSRISLSSQRFLLPSSSLQLFQIYRTGCASEHSTRIRITAAIGTDVAVEESNPSVSEEDADKSSETSPDSVGTSETTPATPAVTPTSQTKRPRPMRKSEMPPVKNEELVLGASFTGKVRSIQPFGAFVDFGAFTDGLVHVSRMSDGYVKDVGTIVSVGQEVKVRILEANMESGRISLTMRDSDDISKLQQSPTGGSNERQRPGRKNAARSSQNRDDVNKSSKFTKGQALTGTVKNLIRAGAFVTLPEGEEGFLPLSEESEGFGNILGNSSLQVGEEVNVRVLRITRGQVTLTMKKEEDVAGMNMKLNQGVVHVATNPFELAFRKNKDIAVFLEEREKVQKSAEILSVSKISELTEGKVDDTVTESEVREVESTTVSKEDQVSVLSASGVGLENEKDSSEILPVRDSISTERIGNDEEPESTSSQNASAAFESLAEEEEGSRPSVSEGSVSSTDQVIDDVPITDEMNKPSPPLETIEEQKISSKGESSVNGSSANLLTDETPITDGVREAGTEIKTVEESEEVLSESTVKTEVPTTGVKEADATSGTVLEAEMNFKNSSSDITESSTDSSTGEITITVQETSFGTKSSGEFDDQPLSSEGLVSEEVAINQSDDSLGNDKVETETPLLIQEEMASADTKDVKVEAPESSNGLTVVPSQGSPIEATISPALVKQLREETGAGMMDCKKALTETGGDIIQAQEFLRKKGLASADKKASRATAEGRIGSYIHDNRIGVLIEVNCETDFVSRGEIFKQLVDDLAMQVAACPQVQYLVMEDVPEETVNKEREIEMQKEDLLMKPEQIRSKIVDGRIRKRLEEFALLEQPYIKNDKMVVKDWVKQTIATIGENIKVRRFFRYNLGEGLEKKSQDFAAEVAAQTAAKPSPEMPKDQSAETPETVEKPTVAVSATLVKQLREETGAGMMDCKKALTETGGDLEKAQEYLRKKGLSSADKKSTRLAAEGRISSYIHDSRIGCLIEVNSETDFVGRNEKFKELVDDLAMQIVACPQVEFVSVEEIPESIVKKEKEIEMQRDDLKSKPESIREKIVEGRINKRLGELALLEQPFIKDDSVLVKDLVKQTVASLGENIRVRRFVRFTLGESKD